MADEGVLTSVSEMIDLAIGSPEVGVVDFNMLQAVLHCFAQQLRILGKNVELRGSIAILPVGRSSDNSQTIAISEFIVDAEDPEKFELAIEPPSPEPESMLVVERRRKVTPSPPSSTIAEHSPDSGGQDSPAGGGGVAGHPSQPRTKPSSNKLVTMSKFNLLQKTVADLKHLVYGTTPSSEDMLQEDGSLDSQGNLKAPNMWANMNVSSRLNAAEESIGKLSSFIENLIGEIVELQKAAGIPPSAATARMAEAAKAMTKASQTPRGPPGVSQGTQGGTQQGYCPNYATKDELKQLLQHLQKLKNDHNHLTETFNGAMMKIDPNFVPIAIDSEPLALKLKQEGWGGGSSGAGIETGNLLEKLCQLEKELKKCCDTTTKSEGLVNDQLSSFQDQLEYMAKQTASLTSQIDDGEKLKPSLQGLMKLFQTVQEMQTQLKEVNETAQHLAAEKQDRQSHIDALLEQIELLKVIKLDREDMVEALADKADLRMLARKVSHDQFDAACDDLSKGLEHALGKLSIQESLWQQALDDIQREIEQKLDKLELSPVKEFFNNKLKQLQENLKQMAALRREAEAAGIKKRLLRDVNCISCDANAVMVMDAPTPLPPKPLPATMSMKPYLSYELDAIRKTQASSLPQRNMHDWERLQQQMQPKQPQKVRSDTNKHLCNRYCGGSHTVTTPAQRVARLGHFIKQWGPEVLPLSSGYAAGDDGRLYKISTVESASVGPGGAVEGAVIPKSPDKKPEAPKSPKPIIIGEDCHCLDPE